MILGAPSININHMPFFIPNSQRLFAVAILAWPPLVAGLLAFFFSDSLGVPLKEIGALGRVFVFPPPVAHLVDFWWIDKPLWMRFYTWAWFLNAAIIASSFGVWLYRNHGHILKISADTSLKRGVVYSLFSFGSFFLVFSGFLFDPNINPSAHVGFILYSPAGFLLGPPVLFSGAFFGLIGGGIYSYVVVKKLGRLLWRGK